jgi:hypothetical protein
MERLVKLTDEWVLRVERTIGDGRVICDRCGATLATYASRCSADLADACPGFVAVENAGAPTVNVGGR